MTKPILDLTRHHFLRPYGDLVVIGTWVLNQDQEDYEPCLVIVPRYRKDGFKPCCVALSASWKYDRNPAYLARASQQFVRMLGMDDCMSNVHKVGEAIHSHLGDLIKMPNNPTQTIVVADASYTVDGKKHTAEILDYKPLAQA